MRIVDVAAFYAPQGGGVRTYIERKMIAGPQAGHEVICVAPGPVDRIEERGPGARIVYLKNPAFPLDRKYHYFRDVNALYATLDKLEPDIVEASSPWRSARLVGEWPGPAPRTLVMHADPASAYGYRWFDGIASRETVDWMGGSYWRHLQKLDGLFDATVTIAGEEQITRFRERGIANISYVAMGIEPGLFTPDLRDEAFRARLLKRCDLPPHATLLLGAGRHGPEKRWPMVIETVTAAGAKAPVGLVLAGNGRERAQVLRAAAYNPHIYLLSPIDDRTKFAQLMASCDALIHGCESETFCMVAGEARASGLPLIVPDLGGCADHARLSGGWIYKSADKNSLVETILGFAGTPQADVRRRAVEHARRVRTIDEHFSELFDFYHRLVGNPLRVRKL